MILYGERFSGGISQGICIPRYYLDGIPVPYIVVSGFGPEDLEGVEVYVSPQIPAEFSSGFSCGVVAYWSRRGPHRGVDAPAWKKVLAGTGVLAIGLLLILLK